MTTQDHELTSYPSVTAEQLSLLYLRDTVAQMAESEREPIRLAQAAKSLHHALQAALTAVLAGGMSIGAYDEKTERQWLEFLQTRSGTQPKSDRVMALAALLDKATSKSIEWTQQPLDVSDEERQRIDTLQWVRDRIEHPRPGFWMIEPAYLYRLFPAAARVLLRCVEAVRHHFEEGEVQEVERLIDAIVERCSTDAEGFAAEANQ